MSKTPRKNPIRELAEELDTFDDMLSSLVEILEQKGILTQQEWERKIKAKIEGKIGRRSYRDLQSKGEKSQFVTQWCNIVTPRRNIIT